MPAAALTPIQDEILRAIILGKRAWTSAAKLAKKFGGRELAALDSQGWITCWAIDAEEKPLRGKAWTLTPWAASQLGVTIEETPDPDDEGVPYWISIWAVPEDLVMVANPRHRSLGCPRHVPDPATSPAAVNGYLHYHDGTPVEIQGRPVRIDPRMARRMRNRRDRRKRESGNDG